MKILVWSKRARGRRGSVLVLVLIVMTVLLMLTSGLAQLSTRADREVAANADAARATYLAEAGLSEAISAVRSGRSGAIGSRDQPALMSNGVFWVVASPVPPASVRLDCTALAGSGRAALSTVVVDLTQEPLFQAVINSDEPLTMNAGVTTDSYDSELGTYAAQMVNVGFGGRPYAIAGGDVASNSDIVMNANAVVFGDATPGPGHFVNDAATGSHVSGSQAPAEEPFTFPVIAPPPIASTGPYTLANGATGALPPGTYGFDNFTLNKDSRLTITGPATLVVADFYGGKDADLVIDSTNGPVTIFVQGDYTHLNGFEASPAPMSPMAVAFMVQGGADVLFPSNTKVRGAYYVPNAAVTFASNCEAWGSFASRRIDMASSMKFHCDEALARHWSSDQEGETIRQLAWQRIAVAPDLLKDRRDPFVLLDLDREELPSPVGAWID